MQRYGTFAEAREARGQCRSCEILMINGVRCHETGCPDAWRDKTYECPWCGQDFAPEHKRQEYCCDSCYAAGMGWPDEYTDETDED